MKGSVISRQLEVCEELKRPEMSLKRWLSLYNLWCWWGKKRTRNKSIYNEFKWKEGVHSSFFDASLFRLSNKNSSLFLSKSLLTLLKMERKEVDKERWNEWASFSISKQEEGNEHSKEKQRDWKGKTIAMLLHCNSTSFSLFWDKYLTAKAF